MSEALVLLQLEWLCSFFFFLFSQKQFLTENVRMPAISDGKNSELILRIYSLLVFMTLEDKECKRTILLPNKLSVCPCYKSKLSISQSQQNILLL